MKLSQSLEQFNLRRAETHGSFTTWQLDEVALRKQRGNRSLPTQEAELLCASISKKQKIVQSLPIIP